MKKIPFLALIASSLLMFVAAPANAGILVDFYYAGATIDASHPTGTTGATKADFISSFGSSLTGVINNSTLAPIDIGPFHKYAAAGYSNGALHISGSPSKEFSAPISKFDNTAGKNGDWIIADNGKYTDTITGIGAGTGTNAFYVLATPVYQPGVAKGTSTESITFTFDGGQTQTISGLHFGDIAKFSYTAAAPESGTVTLSFDGPGPFTATGEYLGYGGFIAAQVPEPSSMVLLGLGVAALGAFRRFRRIAV